MTTSRQVEPTSPAGLATDSPAATGPPALALSALVKRYGGVVAVAGIDLAVERGECLTLLGPSGSGKSTLLRIVSGFASPTSGTVYINGRDVSDVPPSKRGIGMVFQDYALFPHMSVEDNVAYGLKVRGWSRERRDERVAQMLDLVGLSGMQKRLSRQLSGGQQQRVALARALAFDPELLLMDEPLGALDRELRVRMTGELRRIQQELNTTLVYVTHDRDEALTLSDRIAILRDGLIEGQGTPQELYDHPESRFVATFFGWHNIVDVDVVHSTDSQAAINWQGQLTAVPTRTPAQPGRHGLVVPTRALKLARDGHDGPELTGEVIETLYMGDEVRARIRLAGGETLVAHLSIHEIRPVPGESLRLTIDPNRLSIVPSAPQSTA
jgi:putative spermidine/putrescine transport system ATP-binding protein